MAVGLQAPVSSPSAAGGVSAQVIKSDRTYRPDVEGLRAVAVLMVVVNHAGVPWLGGGGGVVAAVRDAVNTTVLPKQPPLIPIPGDDEKGCAADYPDTSVLGCVHGDPNGTHSVAIWGDSHAWMWLPGLDAIGTESHWKVVQFSKNSCQVPDMRLWLDRLRRAYTECDTFRTFTIQKIQALHPDVVLLTSSAKGVQLLVGDHGTTTGVDEAWGTGLTTTIDALKPFTGRIVVLGDSPYSDQDPADCLSAHQQDVQACNTLRSDAVLSTHNQMEQRVTEESGAHYVDVTPWFCTDDVCPSIIGGLAAYRDTFHVSPNYAVWLSNALGTATGLLD